MTVSITALDNSFAASSAPTTEWGELETSLKTDAQINNSNLQIVLNENGSYNNYSPETLASMIYSGTVFIDWCNWPMYYDDASSISLGFSNLLPVLFGNSSANFGEFMAQMGLTVAYKNSSYPIFYPTPSGVDYACSLMTTGAVPSGLGFKVNPNTSFQTIDDTYIYPSFMVRYGKGAYFYAFGNDKRGISGSKLNTGFLSGFQIGVPQSAYIPFIVDELHALLDEGNTSSGPPACTQYGTYVGQGSDAGVGAGEFVFTATQNGVKRNTVVRSNCTQVASYYFGGTAEQFAGTGIKYPSSSSSASTSKSATGTATVTITAGNNSSGPAECGYQFGEYKGTGKAVDVADGLQLFSEVKNGQLVNTVIDPLTCKVEGQYFFPASSGKTAAPSTNTILLYTGAGLGVAAILYYLYAQQKKGSVAQ